MRKLVLLITFSFISISLVRSQIIITKIVIDGETGIPIPRAHVYKVDSLKTGTVTNSNGRFVLTNITKSDILEISHLSYTPFIGAVYGVKSDTIRLFKSTMVLDEILVHNSSGRTIMASVIDSLKVNHFVEPVIYEVYVRILEYEQDYSELHVLSEYLMNVSQKKDNNSEFSIIKTRAKPFSNAGKEHFKEMRMIDATSIYTDNIFKFKDEVLKKKNLRRFEFEIIYDSTNTNNNLIFLNCTPIKEKLYYYTISLLIDKQSYAIQKMIIYYSREKKDFKEIGFKKINDKWYLDYSIKTKYTNIFSQWKPESEAITNRLVIYNINQRVPNDDVYFKTGSNIIVEPLKFYLGDWSDHFWESYNYNPLPDWVQNKIANTKSQ